MEQEEEEVLMYLQVGGWLPVNGESNEKTEMDNPMETETMYVLRNRDLCRYVTNPKP